MHTEDNNYWPNYNEGGGGGKYLKEYRRRKNIWEITPGRTRAAEVTPSHREHRKIN